MGWTRWRSCIWKRSPYFCDQGFVVVGWESRPGVQGGVVDVDLDVVLAGFEEARDVEGVGGVPEGSGGLAVDGDQGGFADGWVVIGVHPGAGVGETGVGEAVGAEGRRARVGSWGCRGGRGRLRPSAGSVRRGWRGG